MRSPSNTAGLALTLALAAAALPGRALAEDEVEIARNGEGRLVGFTDSPLPFIMPASIFPMFPGHATGLVGFHSTGLDEPKEDRFIMNPAADIQAILVSADDGILVYNGPSLMQPGDAMTFGGQPFDYHPVFQIPVGAPGEVFAAIFMFHDREGFHADSEPFAVTFTPEEPCPGDHNGDRQVDFVDLNIVLSGYGSTFNFIDLNLVLSQFGVHCD